MIGPVAVMSLMVRSTAEQQGGLEENTAEWAQYAAFLSFLVGIFQILMAYTGAGTRVAKHVSHVVIAAFTASAGILIISTQLTGIFGLKECKVPASIPGGTSTSCSFVRKIIHVATLKGGCNPRAVILSALTTGLLLVSRSEKLKRMLGNRLGRCRALRDCFR